jgi:outer membrane lipoprotein carrier protein
MLRLLSVVLCAGAAAWAEASSDAVINKVQSRYNSAQTLSVQFSETYSVLGHERQPETGTLVLRKQGKMRWDYAHPEGKVFVSDGKEVFLYTARDNRVEKVPIKEFGGFALRSAGSDEWLEALAKNDRVPYKNVRMLIAPDGEIRSLTVVSRDESTLSFSFTNEKINPPVDNRLFHFTIPPGAEVVDAVEFNSREK